MEKHSELPTPVREYREQWLHRRWQQLRDLEERWAEQAVKYLLFTNAGGAIAVLSFLAGYKDGMSLFAAKAALACFALGVVFVGGTIAQTYHRMARGLNNINQDTGRLYAEQITFDDLVKRDDEINEVRRTRLIFPYLALSMFMAGCLVGSYAIFSTATPAAPATSATLQPSAGAEPHNPHSSVTQHQ